MKAKDKTVVLSLGGSLVVPDRPDVKFLKKFRQFMIKNLAKGRKFIIVVGGGKVCRYYQEALVKVVPVSGADLDWLGIHVTHINAELIQKIFKKWVAKKQIIVSGGLKPGRTTDYVAIMLAKKYGVEQVINMTDVDAVYDKDPDKFPDVRPFKELTWSQYFKIFGRRHKPGASYPFGLTASQLAKKLGIRVIILKGSNLKNLAKALAGVSFKGTIIS
jgi:uridylate kinase